MKSGAAKDRDVRYEECATQEPGGHGPDDGLEAALEKIGGNNMWMWMVFLMASLPGVFNIWALTSYVFLGVELPHWCHIPELDNITWTEAELRNITTGSPEGSSCSAPAYDYAHLASLPFEEANKIAMNTHKNISTFKCESFSYADTGTSIVSEWDLVCDRLVMSSNVQMVVALGKFIGALVFGFVADKWGRKCSFVISCAMYIIAGPLGAIVPVYWVFVFARFILGMAGSGCYNCAFTLLTEVCNDSLRTLLGILYNMSYPVGLIILPLIAYYVPMWKDLQLALSLPALVLILNCWLIPESPRWLLSQGRRDDAWAVVKRADSKLALTRTTTLATVGTGDDKLGAGTAPGEELPWQKRFMESFKKFSSLFSNGDMCRRLMICMYMWCVTALTYYALSLNADNFTTDRYIYTAASGVVEAVSYIIPIPILRWVGRRHTSAAMYLLSGIALLSILAIPKEEPMTILGVAMIGRLCISAVYSVIILYTTELFPTVNRNTAVGTSSTMSHAGSIAAPYIVVQLGAVGRNIPSTICGLCSLSAGLFVLLLPETKGKAMVDTVEEMKENAQKGDKVSIRNCWSCQ